MKQYISMLLAAMALQGCLAVKKYEQPDIEVASQYDNTSLSDSTSIATLPWSQFFNDSQLKKLIEEGMTNNLDVQMAITRLDAASAYFKQARASYLPSISANATASSISTSENGALGMGVEYEQYQLAGKLSWELDLWGKIRSTKRAALAERYASEETVKAIQTQLIANLSTAYVQLLTIDAQLELIKQTVSNREKSYQTMIAFQKAGRVNSTAISSAKAQWLNTQAMQKDIEKSQAIVITTINKLLGKSSGEIKRGTLENNVLRVDTKTGYPMQLLSNRPDVKAAELGLRSTFEQTNAARASFYPALTLSASVGQESVNFDELFSPESLFSNVVGGLTQPILNRRAVKTKYEVAKAKQEEARLRFKQSMINATKEVSDALISVEKESEKVALKQEQQKLLTQTVKESELLLKSGYTTYLEVLTARSTQLSAQIDLINVQYNELRSRIQLYQALGGGWR